MQALRGRLEEVLQIRETQAEMAELLGSQAGSSLVRCSVVSLCDHCALKAETARCPEMCQVLQIRDIQTQLADHMTDAWCETQFGTIHFALSSVLHPVSGLLSVAEGACPQQAHLT